MNEANWFTNETTKLLAENLTQRSKLDELERQNAALRRDVYQCSPTSENDYEGFKWRDACEELERENAALREILINADELERYSGSDGRRQWGKCSTWLHADDVVIIVSAKTFDTIRKEAQP